VLRRAAELLASASDFEDTLRQTIAACLPALADFGFFDVVHGETVRRTVAAHEAPDLEAILAPTQWVKQERTDMNLCALSTGAAALHPETGDGWYQSIAANEGHLAVLRQLAFRSMITVPVRYRGEVVGALTLFMGRSGRNHNEADVEFATEIALLAAPVVVNARLLAAERDSHDRAEAARRRLELLARAGAVLTGSLEPDETLKTIGTTIVPAIADWCRIDLIDEAGQLQRRLAYHSDPERAARALEVAKSLRAAPGTTGSIAWVVKNRMSHYGRYTDPEPMADPALRLYTQTFGMGAHYIIPLVARGRTIGAMGVIQGESGRDLSEDDRALVLELGQRAALALDNARLFAEAEAVRKQAESANRAKDEFLAMLGHELRNPLAPIATALELMAHRESHAHVEERRIIGRQVSHLSRLIDDLLDVSRITQGKIQLRREPVDLRQVVANAVELTRPVYEKRARGLELRVHDAPALVMGDAVRLAQVVCNLLVNAAKFTPGDARVVLSLASEAGGFMLEVEDGGTGIDAHLLPHVFDLFVQGQQAIDRQSGGLGLGLAIVRTLVGMHGGEVSASSEGPGQGSKFSVRLPGTSQQVAPAPAEAPAPQDVPAGRRILVVDDNADAADTLADLLRVVGYEVRCAHRAKGALEVLDVYVPQLALLDIGLPEIDGYQLAGMLRADARAAGMKLVALTGYGRDNDRAKALEARFDEHLVKPVAFDRLQATIDRLLQRG
jgi:signal transduction histidine kinase